MLCARNESDLRAATERIKAKGGRASFLAADVADERSMKELADRAVAEFGGIDTWVNNAGVSIYGRLEDTPMGDKRRLFDVNFWGVVNGCAAAVPHLKQRGGTIINLGSIVSDMAIPLQGIYSASKHAVKAYTEALRMELEAERAPIFVTLVKPAAINTLYTEHARSHMAEEPALPPPIYAPEVVAEAILRCAEKRIGEVTVGGAGRMQTFLHAVAPRTSELVMERMMISEQKKNQPADGVDSLYAPSADGRRQGNYGGHVMRSSLYTRAMLSDAGRVLPVLALGAGMAALSWWARRAAA
jgi:short-subunit dehydrogenase